MQQKGKLLLMHALKLIDINKENFFQDFLKGTVIPNLVKFSFCLKEGSMN